MQSHDDDQKNLARLDIGGTEHRIQVSDQKDARGSKSDGDKDPIQDRDG